VKEGNGFLAIGNIVNIAVVSAGSQHLAGQSHIGRIVVD
jgi:hypothetical protein